MTVRLSWLKLLMLQLPHSCATSAQLRVGEAEAPDPSTACRRTGSDGIVVHGRAQKLYRVRKPPPRPSCRPKALVSSQNVTVTPAKLIQDQGARDHRTSTATFRRQLLHLSRRSPPRFRQEGDLLRCLARRSLCGRSVPQLVNLNGQGAQKGPSACYGPGAPGRSWSTVNQEAADTGPFSADVPGRRHADRFGGSAEVNAPLGGDSRRGARPVLTETAGLVPLSNATSRTFIAMAACRGAPARFQGDSCGDPHRFRARRQPAARRAGRR